MPTQADARGGRERKGCKKEEENCSNPDSHLVSHDSTNESLPCLTLLIGREAVFSWRYGRRCWCPPLLPTCTPCNERGACGRTQTRGRPHLVCLMGNTNSLPSIIRRPLPPMENTGGLESQTNNGREGEMCYGAQILRRKAKPQQVVTTRLLHCLQYLLPHLSRLQRIHPRAYFKLPFKVEPTRPFRQAGH